MQLSLLQSQFPFLTEFVYSDIVAVVDSDASAVAQVAAPKIVGFASVEVVALACYCFVSSPRVAWFANG